MSDDIITETQHVERTDVGVSVTVELKRGTGTRDQDKIAAKCKGETRAEVQSDVDHLKPWLRGLAEDVRTWQPDGESE